MPKSKLEFWRPKLEGNRKRDVLVRTNLEGLGWEVVELWECQLNKRELAQFLKWFSALIKSKMPKKKVAK